MGRGKRCWAWTHSPGQRAGADTIPRNPTEELSEAWVQQDVQAGSRGSGTFLSHPTVCSRASRVRNSSCGACRHRDQVLGWPASPRRSGCYRGTCLSPPQKRLFPYLLRSSWRSSRSWVPSKGQTQRSEAPAVQALRGLRRDNPKFKAHLGSRPS